MISDSTPYGRWLRRQRFKTLREILREIPLDYWIIDVGCGSGDSLKLMRDLGFMNVVGIDISKSAIYRCIKKGFILGKDIHVMNAENTFFPNDSFDVVFSEGLWEHFPQQHPAYFQEGPHE